jgi:Lamin Tail Domain
MPRHQVPAHLPSLRRTFAYGSVAVAFCGACLAQQTEPGPAEITGTRPPSPVWPDAVEQVGNADARAVDASARDAGPDANTPRPDATNVNDEPSLKAAADAAPERDSAAPNSVDAAPADVVPTDAAGDLGRAANPQVATGAVVITEVMFNPSGNEPFAEWIEVYNPGVSSISLAGMTLVDSVGRTAVLPAGTALAANTYGVVVRRVASSGVPPTSIIAEYGGGLASGLGVMLANGSSGTIALRSGATLVSEAPYGRCGAGGSGASAELRSPQSDPNNASNWCTALATWPASGTDRGSPGAAATCALKGN